MPSKVINAQKHLFSGNFQQALKVAGAEDQCWAIGALCFMGRVEQAETLYRKAASSMTREELSATRFFLTIGHLRQLNFERARKLSLHEKRRELKAPSSAFYKYQGLAVLRYYQNQLRSSEVFASKALEEASASRFTFGWYLSLDLLGHLHVRRGEIPRGIEELGQAIDMAKQLGNRGWQDASRTSKQLYEVQFGFSRKSPVAVLRQQARALKAQDEVSQINLELELCRQLTLSGQFLAAEESLKKVQYIVYSKSLPRQDVLFHLRSAELSYQRGNFHGSLTHLSNAKNRLTQISDDLLEQALQGLEWKVFQKLNFSSEQSEELRQNILQHPRLQSSVYHQRLVFRQLKSDEAITSKFVSGMDPVADLLDQLSFSSSETTVTASLLEKILGLGYLSLLIDACQLERGRPSLLIDVVPGQLLLHESSGLQLQSLNKTSLASRLLLALQSGPKTKKQLIEQIWNYEYDPYRHDSLIHMQVTRLRKVLGPLHRYLIADGRHYHFEDELDIRIHRHQRPTQKAPRVRQDEALPIDRLNYRQITLLDEMGDEDFVSTPQVAERFEVTDITANRDLRELVSLQRLQRVGKARATRYRKL